jgi:lipoprotein Spr
MLKRWLRGRTTAVLLLCVGSMMCGGPAAALDFSEQLGHAGAASSVPPDYERSVPLQLAEAAMLAGDPTHERVMSGALSMLGTHYRLGSNGDAVDCSSLVQRIFRAVGVELPRTTREQVKQGMPVRLTELRKGDLLFYRWQPRNLHVAIYMDDDYIVHASPSVGRVVLTRLNSSWRRRLVAARRLLES